MSNSTIWPIDKTLSGTTTPGQSGPGSDWQWRSTQHSPKLQHYWSLIIRLFSVISGHSLGVGSYPSTKMHSLYSIAPANLAETGMVNNLFSLLWIYAPESKVCRVYDTKLYLVTRLQLWRSVECGVLLYCHYSQFTYVNYLH